METVQKPPESCQQHHPKMHLSFLLLLCLPFLITGSPIDGARSLKSQAHGTYIRARNAPRDSVRVDLAQLRLGCERWYVEDVPLEGKVSLMLGRFIE